MNVLERIFGVTKPLIAMCHLRALPGRPRHDGRAGMDAIYRALRDDVLALQRAGVDGLLFCNEHDLPYSVSVGVEAAAAQAAVIGRLTAELTVPYGVDLLWDARSALAVARATGASFVREVFTGVFESDMGLLVPDFGELAGYRHAIGGDDIAIFTNVTPEFSRSVSGRPVDERARGAAFLGVDALLVSGPQAGAAVDLADLRAALDGAGGVPVLANTGVTRGNAGPILALADGAIVGTDLKVDGSTWNAVDPQRASEMVAAVRKARNDQQAGLGEPSSPAER
ncbi:MAG TPA: BtpA/SgcQ family protein [Streptosporangiaceae bacterium]|nr:BtpA/SgcQ family protein [Streptosporangiaceae bacterium]